MINKAQYHYVYIKYICHCCYWMHCYSYADSHATLSLWYTLSLCDAINCSSLVLYTIPMLCYIYNTSSVAAPPVASPGLPSHLASELDRQKKLYDDLLDKTHQIQQVGVMQSVLSVCVCACACACMRVCVCVRARDTTGDHDTGCSVQFCMSVFMFMHVFSCTCMYIKHSLKFPALKVRFCMGNCTALNTFINLIKGMRTQAINRDHV